MEPNNYKIIFYTDKEGRCPADEFLDGLELKVRAKVEKWMEKLEQYGPNLPRPHADKIKGKIRELRIIFHSNHHRLLFFFCGKTIVITHGFIKRTWKIPKTEIERAERLMQDFLQRFGKGGEIKS
jgi:phage-related protein